VVSGKNDSTLQVLAAQLDLRMNTVWAFKHKNIGTHRRTGEKGQKANCFPLGRGDPFAVSLRKHTRIVVEEFRNLN